MSTTTSVWRLVVSFVLGLSALAAPALAHELPDGPGKETVVRACSTCHSTETIENRHQDNAAWTDTVFKMVDFGAEATKEEREAIVRYLTANFGPLRAARTTAVTAAPAVAPAPEAPPDPEAAPPPGAAKGKMVNVNEATAKDLQSGLELTEKESEAIVQYRQEHGPFKDWRDVVKVEGIDRKKIEAAKDRMTFGESAVPRRKP